MVIESLLATTLLAMTLTFMAMAVSIGIFLWRIPERIDRFLDKIDDVLDICRNAAEGEPLFRQFPRILKGQPSKSEPPMPVMEKKPSPFDLPPEAIAPSISNPPRSPGGFGTKQE